MFETVIATTAVLTLMPKFLLYSYSSVADPFTVLFSHVVENWKSTNTRNLWLFGQNRNLLPTITNEQICYEQSYPYSKGALV